jgi:enoyl-CoA hydratase/carnithine racemase
MGSWQAGSAADEEVRAVALDRCGRVFLAGATLGSFHAQNLGGRDAWISRAVF